MLHPRAGVRLSSVTLIEAADELVPATPTTPGVSPAVVEAVRAHAQRIAADAPPIPPELGARVRRALYPSAG